MDLPGEAASMGQVQSVLGDNSIMVLHQVMAPAVSFGNWCPAVLQLWQGNHSRQLASQGAEAAWHNGEKQLQPRGTWGHFVEAEIYWGFTLVWFETS